MKHTKEPWRLGRFTGPESYEEARETCGKMDVVVDTDTGPYVLAACNINFPDDAMANAHRIVACVNACAGISTTGLEIAGFGGLHHIAEATFEQRMARNEIIRQRDELLAAMRYLRQHRLWANSHAKAVIEAALEKVGAGETAHNAKNQGDSGGFIAGGSPGLPG